MIVLPIVERELRVASRRAGTYWSRLVAALAAMALLVYLLVVLGKFFAPVAAGASMFRALSNLALVWALLAGVRGTADCLSAEKREGTLGLLFLTDLKAHDVVLGKLAATSLNAFYGLLAILPVLALPILMGGVAAGEFWRMALVLLNALFFSLGAGLLVSAGSRVGRKAGGGTLLLVFVFTAGLPMAGTIVQVRNGPGLAANLLFQCSPWFTSLWALGTRPPGALAEFWTSVALVHGCSWCFLLLACLILPRVWRDKPAAGGWLRWREWVRDFHFGNAARRHAFRERALAVNPIYWLASRERLARIYPWIFLVSMVAIWFWGWWLDRQMFRLGGALILTYVTHFFFKNWVAGMACGGFAADRDQGALELLLSTRLTVPELVRGQWLALVRQFGWPVLALVLLDVALLVNGLMGRTENPAEFGEWRLMMAANVVVFVADVIALGWLGLWRGVSSRSTQSAVSRTLATILLLPWAGVLAVILLNVVFDLRVARPTVFVLLWLGLSLGVDIAVAVRAQESLLQNLRRAATERFSHARAGKRGWWGREVAE